MLMLFLAKLVIFRKEQELSKSNSNLKVKVNPNHYLKRLPKSVFSQLLQEIYLKKFISKKVKILSPRDYPFTGME